MIWPKKNAAILAASSSGSLLLLELLAAAVFLPSAVQAQQTVIPRSSFNSQSDFDAAWNYLYPWGTDHNGAARMDKSHVAIGGSGGMLTLTATRVSGQPPASHGGRQIAINYLSGAVNAKQHFTVARGGGHDYSGEFRAPTTRGTWPAFWLTAVNGWPPEIDMAEWKGDGLISFNTFDTSSEVASANVNYPDPGSFHSIRVETRDQNGEDVKASFYLDGRLVATQVGRGYVGKPMYLIINLQMEGSSGSPGPSGTTTYQVRNLQVVSHNP